jgi:hypothetical protein
MEEENILYWCGPQLEKSLYYEDCFLGAMYPPPPPPVIKQATVLLYLGVPVNGKVRAG